MVYDLPQCVNGANGYWIIDCSNRFFVESYEETHTLTAVYTGPIIASPNHEYWYISKGKYIKKAPDIICFIENSIFKKSNHPLFYTS